MWLFIRPLRMALKALLTESTPRQLALGFAFGILVGLVPKGNLLAVALGIFLAALRVNLGVAGMAVMVCSLISPVFDPIFDMVGRSLLSHPALQQFWTDLYNTPLMPWTDFNNSVVLGSFVVGVGLVFPVYRLTIPVFEKYSGRLARRVRQWKLVRILLGVEWADRLGVTVES